MERCDVLIVGGGPAGSSCAWALRDAGLLKAERVIASPQGAEVVLADGRRLKLAQNTDYPWDGRVRLTLEEVADTLVDLELDGVDLTVRPGGHIEPAEVEFRLPQALDIFNDRGLDIGQEGVAGKRVGIPERQPAGEQRGLLEQAKRQEMIGEVARRERAQAQPQGGVEERSQRQEAPYLARGFASACYQPFQCTRSSRYRSAGPAGSAG
jgi:glycine/D-amino acid oxidase-like deaminating enzyme